MNPSPSMSTPDAPVRNGQLDILRMLQPVIRAIGLGRVARGTMLGVAVGTLLGAIILAVSHVHPITFSVQIAFSSIVAGVVAGLIWGIVQWPAAGEAARRADFFFGLDDRLTTALELRSSDEPVARIQNRDTARYIDGLTLSRSQGPWLHWREVVVAAAAGLLFAGSLILGVQAPHQHASAPEKIAHTSRQAQQIAAKQIQQLQARIHAGLTPSRRQTREVQKLNLALSRLRRQLLKASTTRSALRAISVTQQKLHSLAAGLHPINARAVAQLNSSMAHYLPSHRGNGKTGTPSRSAAATAQALNRLAQSLVHLSPAQRAALARTLARAANANPNTGLRSSLRQAASALASGAPHAAATALQRAARSLAQSAGAQATQSRANALSAQLGAIKNGLANSGARAPSGHQPNGSRKSSTKTAGQGNAAGTGQRPGKGPAANTGRGKGNGQGARAGKGKGARPGSGVGRGSGRGSGTVSRRGQGATGAGKGSSGAHGRGGHGRPAPTRAGRAVTVYIPGTQGKGPDVTRNGPNGAPQPGALVPYRQVLGQYAQQARQTLDRAALPPSVQGYVHRYFSTISH